MAKNKLAKKRKHKRDVAEKRRTRAFYRMREQNRREGAELLTDVSGREAYTGVIVVLVALAGIVTAVYHAVKTIVNT